MGQSDFGQNVLIALVYSAFFGFGVFKVLQWMHVMLPFRHF
jgi:hypothetical protein